MPPPLPSGKSTTIWHLINSRVAPDRKCLVTCSRNQAVNAVVEKVASFGCLVFGSEARLGDLAKEYTLKGRLRNDPEMLWWSRLDCRVTAFAEALQSCSFDSWWRQQQQGGPGSHLKGLARLVSKEAAEQQLRSERPYARSARRSGAGLWLTALRAAFKPGFEARFTAAEATRMRLWTRLVRRASERLSARLLPDVKVLRLRWVSPACRALEWGGGGSN